MELARLLIPRLTAELHKGQCGKVGVVGGCLEYTGAPYYAAFTALKTGADLAHVFCAENAGTAIKAYSPELIVHPVVPNSLSSQTDQKAALDPIRPWLSRLTSLVVGPGLGRSESMQIVAGEAIQAARDLCLPLVIDGDGLYYVENKLDSVIGNDRCVLSPNKNEFKRLCKAALQAGLHDCNGSPPEDMVCRMSASDLASALGGVIIVRKGAVDTVSNGEFSVDNSCVGSSRRCGGQGDVLAGALATFLSWAHSSLHEATFASQAERQIAACVGSCCLVKGAARAAYVKNGRSTTTVEIIQELPRTFQQNFERNEL